MKDSSASRRVNLVLGPRSAEALDKLKASLEATSHVDVVRIALQVTKHLADEIEAGGQVMIERKSGELVRIRLLPFVARG